MTSAAESFREDNEDGHMGCGIRGVGGIVPPSRLPSCSLTSVPC